jgi:hypothetical protein
LKSVFIRFILLFVPAALIAQSQPPTVDDVLHAYVLALGGEAALNKIETREINAKVHRFGEVTYYWAKPDKVLRISHHEKAGYDGSTWWALSKKKKLTKLPKPEQKEFEINADPIRYAHLRDLYSDVSAAPAERIDDRPMDVLVAPNNIGSTKFYFDHTTHLLMQIEDFGTISAYYKHITEFSDYKRVDGIEFPFRIVHSTTEPGRKDEEIRVSKLAQNVELDPQIFTKPRVGAVTLGGKR